MATLSSLLRLDQLLLLALLALLTEGITAVATEIELLEPARQWLLPRLVAAGRLGSLLANLLSCHECFAAWTALALTAWLEPGTEPLARELVAAVLVWRGAVLLHRAPVE